MKTVPPKAVRLAGARLSALSAAVEQPERIALVDDGEPITYGAFEHGVRRVLGGLVEAGVPPCDASSPVAFVATASRSTLLLVHALIELGVPAAPIHPKLAAGERRRLLEALSPALVLEEDDPLPEGTPWHGPPLSHSPEAPLAIVQTSGSSGAPKNVVLPRRAFVAAADASAGNLGSREDERWLLCMPLAHVGGLSIPIRAVLDRYAVVLPPPGPFDPATIARVLERDRVTLASWVPTMLSRMLEDPGWRPPRSLRGVLLGGAGAPPELLRQAAQRGVPVLATYGLTETCGQVTTQRPGASGGDGDAGAPLHGIEVRVTGGEIEVAGPTLLSGWWEGGTPVDEGGWLRTGDLGRFDEQGRLHVLGRVDDRIVTGGENVDPLEVELLLATLPGVAEACVFGIDDERWGARVAAALVATPDGEPLRELDAALRERLAPHKRPREVAVLEALPATPSGKPDRRATARAAAAALRPLEAADASRRPSA